MKLVRNVISDLVERRLWPVAVALVAGLLAVPLLLGGGSEPTDPPAVAGVPAVEPPGAEGSLAVAGIEQSGPAGGRRGGSARDPFHHPRKDKTSGAGAGSGPTLASAVGAPGGSASSGSITASGPSSTPPGLAGGGTAGGSPTKRAVRRSEPESTWRVDLRFGRGDDLKARNDVELLSPLPSADDPFFVFTKVKRMKGDRLRAVFLVSADARPTGDGTCRPSQRSCERVEMDPGDVQFFDVRTGDGDKVVQYQLELVRIEQGRRSQTRATRARASVDPLDRRGSVRAQSIDRIELRTWEPAKGLDSRTLLEGDVLPRRSEPAAVFLGVDDDGSALFLNPYDVGVKAEHCDPDPKRCTWLRLDRGEGAVFDYDRDGRPDLAVEVTGLRAP